MVEPPASRMFEYRERRTSKSHFEIDDVMSDGTPVYSDEATLEKEPGMPNEFVEEDEFDDSGAKAGDAPE